MNGRAPLVTLALGGGWIIRAIEEYGVGGTHKPDSEQFLLIGSQVATDIGITLVRAGRAPAEGSATDAIRHVLDVVKADAEKARKSGP